MSVINSAGECRAPSDWGADEEKKKKKGSSHCGAGETDLTSNHEVLGLIPGFTYD